MPREPKRVCSVALTAELSATPDSPPCRAAACVRCTLRLHSTLTALLKSLRIVLLQAATALMGGAAAQQRLATEPQELKPSLQSWAFYNAERSAA